MFFEDLFVRENSPVTVCLMGAGQFGASFIRQAHRIPYLKLRAVCSLNVEECINALTNSGIKSNEIAVVSSKEEAYKAFIADKYLVSTSFDLFVNLGIDVLVESSGAPNASSRAANLAIENKMHVIMASKETDSVVGPILCKKAKEKNVVYTTGDGDQPSILIGLISWARSLGLNIVAAGKSSEYDFVYDETNKKLTCSGQQQKFDCDLSDLWNLGTKTVEEINNGRKALMSNLSFRANPDLCEMVLVSNATGIEFDTSKLHAPVARIIELADFFCNKADGGLINKQCALDIFNCLRKEDETSMAGGVYIIVTCDDTEIWQILKEKGHILSRNGKYACIYIPRHLMGLEIATSIMAAATMNHATAGKNIQPVSDMQGYALKNLPAGTILKMGGHHHTIDGVGCQVGKYQKLNDAAPIPFYLLSNCKLKKDIQKGHTITLSDVEIPESSSLLQLRQEQDQHFFN